MYARGRREQDACVSFAYGYKCPCCAKAGTPPLRINAVTLLNIVAHNSVAIKTAFFSETPDKLMWQTFLVTRHTKDNSTVGQLNLASLHTNCFRAASKPAVTPTQPPGQLTSHLHFSVTVNVWNNTATSPYTCME